MLTPRFPYPPVRGDCLRAWGELEQLASRHDVWLASLADGPVSPQAFEHVRARCRDIAVFQRNPLGALIRGGSSMLRGHTVTEGYFANGALAKQVSHWSQEHEFDSALIFSSAMAQYSGLVGDARRVLDMNDVDSIKWERYSRRGPATLRWAFAIEAKRVAAAEKRWCREHDCTVVVNDREQRRLLERCGPASSAVVRSGVAVPADMLSASAAEIPTAPRIGMVGSMSYPPNVRGALWFAENVWPAIRSAAPTAEWLVIGRDPTRAVRRLARLPGVTVTGLVPDLQPLVRSLRVFVAPVRDDLGVQTKLIEALAHGRPAVCTRETADGMDWEGEAPFLIADGATQFAESVVRLLGDDELTRHLWRAAIANVQDFYEVREQVRTLEGLLMPPGLAHAAPVTTRREPQRARRVG